ALARWSGSRRQLIAMEGHGREPLFPDVDLSRTVGWFTSLYPVLLDLPTYEPGSSLKAVKEQLRHIPGRGIGYGILRYLAADDATGAKLAAFPQPAVIFNYVGQFDQVLQEDRGLSLASEPIGPQQSPRAPRPFVLEVTGVVVAGRLQLDIRYSRNLHRRETVAGLLDVISSVLRELVDHCQSEEARGYTPSDFPLASLAAPQLDRIAREAKDIEDIYALSPTQQGMLFHSLYNPSAGLYFQQISSLLEGPIDHAALRAAWQVVVDRHPTLRTSFRWQDLREPVQIVHRQAELQWQEHDWRHMQPAEIEARLTELQRGERLNGFDLARAPLLRITLITLGPDRHRFIWSYHHLVLDGWSTPIVFSEVIDAYRAITVGKAAELPRPVPYRRHIAWLREQSQDGAKVFWSQRLAGFSPSQLDLPAPQSTDDVADDSACWRHLPASMNAELQAFARKHRVTLQILAQGALGLVLARYSGSRDVALGLTISGRSPGIPEVDRIAGLFINTVPVRIEIDEQAELVPWLQSLMQRQAEQDEHSYAPLVDIQGWSGVPRGTSLFEAILVFENYPLDESLQDVGDLRMTDTRIFERTNYPLVLTVIPGASLTLRLTYDPGRLDAVSADRLLGHFVRVLEGMVASSRSRLSGLDVLGSDEAREQLVEWNRTGVAVELGDVAGAISAQAGRTPAAAAVCLGSEVWRYEELEAQSNRVAHRLRSLGVGPECVVGLCLRRRPWLVAGLLGILKAGGAYLPLDPTLPPERLGYMLSDAGVSVVVSED
ncbi:MAG TPA: condensation domain-containing protein, partial [Reyranella sp.]|nr:condensation domain-containing protein [Reyranella sp.]